MIIIIIIIKWYVQAHVGAPPENCHFPPTLKVSRNLHVSIRYTVPIASISNP